MTIKISSVAVIPLKMTLRKERMGLKYFMRSLLWPIPRVKNFIIFKINENKELSGGFLRNAVGDLRLNGYCLYSLKLSKLYIIR